MGQEDVDEEMRLGDLQPVSVSHESAQHTALEKVLKNAQAAVRADEVPPGRRV